MSTRSEKALKAQKEKYHAILRELVQEVPNKTCADCLAKGPRWSSWSLGVFVCIRCAGIHRNLGVHISKVKSVDLDSWSTEQIEHILKWGNKRAAEFYECYLPKDFTRPQGNHAVESFIRNKYEKKLYTKKDGEPEANPTSKLNRLKEVSAPMEKENKIQSTHKKRQRPEKKLAEEKSNSTILTMASQNNTTDAPASAARLASANHVKSSSMNDLLSLDHPGPTTPDVKPSASSNDLLNFGLFSDPVPTHQASDPFQTGTQSNDFPQTASTVDPFQDNTKSEVQSEPPKSTKDSIMSLYASGNTSQQKVYGVPGGVYMNQQKQAYPAYPQSGMPNQFGQMNTQMQQMNLNVAPRMRMMQQPGFGQQQPGYSQQQLRFNQRQSSGFNHPQGGYNQQFNANQFNQVGYNTNMYGNNMTNQTNNFNHQQYPNNMQQTNFGNAMGQNVMTNSTWSTNQSMMGGMTQQQQPMMANGTAPMNLNMNASSGMSSTNTGHTMNNQLWN